MSTHRCPECGSPGKWRSGVGFEHEMICMNKEAHGKKNNVVWEPGVGAFVEPTIVIPNDDSSVVVRNKKHMTISLAKVVDAINQKYSPAIRILEGAAVRIANGNLEIEWETRL